ncbi:MAG: hypothetical protein GYA58_06650 [Anaerolineaceae bacterium]|nr:hypothetical protein [Anaerolineaceae bacterium]
MSSSNQPRRFLILTGDAGFGHRSAAQSVSNALKELYGENAITSIVDPVIERPSPSVLRRSQTDYDKNVLNNQDFYRFTYEISDSRTASTMVEGALAMLLHKNMQEVIQEFQPDAVLSTHHMFNPPLGTYLYTHRLDTPFYTVVTDLADVHALWFHPSPDHFFVATDSVRAQALTAEIPAEKISVSGIPVDPRFAHPSKERTLRRCVMGLEPDLPTLLFVGSKRVNGILEALEALENCPHPFQVLVASGGDETLYQSVTSRNWKFPLHCEKYVSDIPDWMNCADVLITKAGGLIVSEGLAAGLPILLIDNLPGQEDGNVRYVTENGAGLRVENEIELLAVLKAWLQPGNPALAEVAARSRALGHPRAALDVAEALWQISAQGIPHRVVLPQPNWLARAHERAD